MTRTAMGGYGLFDLIFPLALITFLLSRKIKLNLKYTWWLYYGGIIMIITQIITLTRRTQIDIIGTILIIVLIIAYIFRTGQVSEMIKIIYSGSPGYFGFIFHIPEVYWLRYRYC